MNFEEEGIVPNFPNDLLPHAHNFSFLLEGNGDEEGGRGGRERGEGRSLRLKRKGPTRLRERERPVREGSFTPIMG